MDQCAPPSCRADSQREINHAEGRSGGKLKDLDLCPGSTRSTEPPRRQPKRKKWFEISGGFWSRNPPASARSFRLNRHGRHINSERFWFSVPGLCTPPSSRADSQREINHAENRSGGKGRATNRFCKILDLRPGPTRSTEPPRRQPKREGNGSQSREIFGRAAPAPGPVFRLIYLSWAICTAARGKRIDARGQTRPS